MKLISASAEPGIRTHWMEDPLRALLERPLPVPREHWVVLDDSGAFKGRIGAALSMGHPGLGTIGFFELARSDDEATCRLLLDAATRFLRGCGAKRAVGPMHLNTWLPYRFVTRHEGPGPFGWEPSNPPEYPELWKRFGFQSEQLYASQGHADPARFIERMKPAWDRAIASGYRFRSWNSERLLESEVPILHEISMRGFRGNFLFEPLPLELFRELYVPLTRKRAGTGGDPLALSAFVVSPEGREVGFAFNFLDDMGEASGGAPRIVLKTATVLPEHRGRGLSNALMYETLKALDLTRHPEFVAALVRDGAQSESYGRHCPRIWRHEYELLSMQL
jgi:GNAT superfamily N-acetyltransferase